jgi:hypothetical protein
MVAKSNASKTPRFESWPNLIKLHQIQWWGFFISHPHFTFLVPEDSD